MHEHKVFLLFCPVSRSSPLVGKMDSLPRRTHPRRQRTDDRGIVGKRNRPTLQFAVRRPSGRKRGLGYYYRTHSLSLSLSLPLSLPLSPCGFVLRLFLVCFRFVICLFFVCFRFVLPIRRFDSSVRSSQRVVGYVTTTTLVLVLIHVLVLVYVGFACVCFRLLGFACFCLSLLRCACVCFRLLGTSTLFPARPFGFKQFCTLRLSDFETRFPKRPPPTPN